MKASVSKYQKKGMNIPPTAKYFDCRRYIKPDCEIQFYSMNSCPTVNDVTCKGFLTAKGIVKKVYAEFVIVQLNHTTECVNRWDIIKVNDTYIKDGAFERPYPFMDKISLADIALWGEDDQFSSDGGNIKGKLHEKGSTDLGEIEFDT